MVHGIIIVLWITIILNFLNLLFLQDSNSVDFFSPTTSVNSRIYTKNLSQRVRDRFFSRVVTLLAANTGSKRDHRADEPSSRTIPPFETYHRRRAVPPMSPVPLCYTWSRIRFGDFSNRFRESAQWASLLCRLRQS